MQLTIHREQNLVRRTMNSFVIAVGGYSPKLSAKAMEVASAIGIVKVNMGNTACKIPLASDYILKMHRRGTLGKKRKSPRC